MLRTVVLVGALIAAGTLGIGADHAKRAVDLTDAASGFHALVLHDNCTGDYPPQPDTCLHKQLIEKSFTFGGSRDVIYDVRLRIRGIFEPTTIADGETPYRITRTSKSAARCRHESGPPGTSTSRARSRPTG